MALTEEQRNPWRAIVAGGDYNLSSQDWEDLLTELDSLYAEAPIAHPASECQCSMTTKLVGDGCVHCNPEYTTDHEAQPASDYKKLIAQLKDPEMHFPGKFDTVKRANAMLMCLCQEAADALSASAPSEQKPETFQSRVELWLIACFGEEISNDKEERNHRFLEESLELVQATGCTASEAHQLVDYVFGRPVGEPHQEVGGVMVTLAALCRAHALNMHANGETELARIWTKVEKIRAKQAAKPKHSPLPEAAAPQPDYKAQRDADRYRWLRDNNKSWSWNPSQYNKEIISGFAAFNTGYLGFAFESAVLAAIDSVQEGGAK